MKKKNDNSWQDFDARRAAATYVSAGILSEDEFWEMFEHMVQVRMLPYEDLDWLLFDHALGAMRGAPLVIHYKAIAAGLNLQYGGIESFYRRVIAEGRMPNWTLNRTHFYALPDPDQRIGELLVEAGAIAPSVVDRSLEIKSQIHEQLGVNVAVGQIFRTVGRLSVIDFFQLLGHQVHVKFVSLDESAPEIFEAAMNR